MTAENVLVVLRCGDRSLHEGWLSPGRTWALAVSYFGDDNERTFPEARYVHRYKGGKWDGIYNFLQSNPDVLDHYDYFWMPDDDIAASPDALENFFEIVRRNRFELAQPSLAPGSYVSHLITLNNCLFRHRLVNFVELMVPLLSKELLLEVLPAFETARTGFGIDFVWNRMTRDPQSTVAIIDSVQVEHTRAVGGALHAMIEQNAFSPAEAEQRAFLEPYGNVSKVLVAIGGVTVTGADVRGLTATTLISMFGLLIKPFGNKGFTANLTPIKFARWVMRHSYACLRARPQLEKVSLVSRSDTSAAPRDALNI